MSDIAVEDGLKVAILLPCRNDGMTIGGVVQDFAQALPAAEIFVFDNNSTDDTARTAARAGARVFRETRPGKENVVRRMFADIDADIYLMAAGDGSSDPGDAPSLINALITEHVDMVVGTQRRAGRPPITGDRFHRWLFRGDVTDMSSAYRAFTRRFVKSFPAIPAGLGIEAEMSVHASQLMIPVAEIDVADGPAPNGATPTRRTLGDGFTNFRTLAMLMKETRPFAFLSAFAMLFWIAGLVVMVPAIGGWAETGFAPQLATMVAASALFIIGFTLAGSGLILESVTRSRVEQKRILFLAVPALGVQ